MGVSCYRNGLKFFTKDGGLSKEEGLHEFNTLVKKDTLFLTHNLESEIKPLGVLHFNSYNYDFSLLLRLVPSSIRASFTQHPSFNQLMPQRKKTAYFHMGKRVACLLQDQPPLHHQNLALNNMVFVDQDTYDLTDWSETSTLFEEYSALDYPRCLFPVTYLAKQLPLSDAKSYVKGLTSHYSFPFSLPKKLTDCVTINQQLLADRGFDYYLHQQKSPQNYDHIIGNINYYHDYFFQPAQEKHHLY